MTSNSEPQAIPESLLQTARRQEADPFQGIRIGSIFGPSYMESYAEAWRGLLPNAVNLALPLLYLQRHTFELLVKELLIGTLETRAELHALDDLFGTTKGAGPLDPDDLEKAYTTHALGELFPCLERNLRALRRPTLPDEFVKLRKLFTDVDEDRPDRLRYDTMFNRKQRTTQRSFPTGRSGKPPKHAPCYAVAALLDEILRARSESLAACVEHQPPPVGELTEFYTATWESTEESEATVVYSLSPLVSATRDGSLKWNGISSAGLDLREHEVLRRIENDALAPFCLEASLDERLLTMVILKNARGEINWGDSSFFLAARRPNGTLTAGVWASDCQSNLIYEIQEAFKRTSGTASP